jgi:dihydrofolate reductase
MKRKAHSQAVKSGGRTPAAPRKIIVYVATSADGYIARPDGSVDWLDRPMPKGAYGMTAFARSIDTILWGRKTYDFAAKMGGVGAYGKVKHYAFSRRPPSDPLPGVDFVSESIPEFVGKLQAVRGKNIWMMGGAEIIASFLDVGAIDEFSIHVIPVMIGEGIPLVAPRHRNIPLELISARSFPDGVVHLNYSVRPIKRLPSGAKRSPK